MLGLWLHVAALAVGVKLSNPEGLLVEVAANGGVLASGLHMRAAGRGEGDDQFPAQLLSAGECKDVGDDGNDARAWCVKQLQDDTSLTCESKPFYQACMDLCGGCSTCRNEKSDQECADFVSRGTCSDSEIFTGCMKACGKCTPAPEKTCTEDDDTFVDVFGDKCTWYGQPADGKPASTNCDTFYHTPGEIEVHSKKVNTTAGEACCASCKVEIASDDADILAREPLEVPSGAENGKCSQDADDNDKVKCVFCDDPHFIDAYSDECAWYGKEPDQREGIAAERTNCEAFCKPEYGERACVGKIGGGEGEVDATDACKFACRHVLMERYCNDPDEQLTCDHLKKLILGQGASMKDVCAAAASKRTTTTETTTTAQAAPPAPTSTTTEYNATTTTTTEYNATTTTTTEYNATTA